MIKNICRKILEDSPFYGLDNKQMGEVVDKLVDFIKKSKHAEPKEIGQLTSPHQALIRRLRDEYRLQNEIKLHDTIDDLIKETEIMREQLEMMREVGEYIGQYFSKEYIYKKILRMTDEEIDEMKKQIDKEREEDPPEQQGFDGEFDGQ